MRFEPMRISFTRMSSQVSILCVFCLIRLSQPLLGKEVDVEELKKLPGLDLVKDVPITWKNNRYQTLSSVLGSNVDRWGEGRKENPAVITKVYFTAMCCLYGQNIVTVIKKTEQFIRKCKKLVKSANVFFNLGWTEPVVRCIMDIPYRLQCLKPEVFDMLTTVFEYSRLYDETMDKNFLNSLFSIYLYLNNSGRNSDRDRSTMDLSVDPAISVDQLVAGFNQMTLYILNSVVAFSIRNCSPSAFDEPLSSAGQYEQLAFSKLKLPAAHYIPEFFDPKRIMLADLLETELVAGQGGTRLKYLTVSWNYQDSLQVQDVYSCLLDGFRPESITKFQTLVFECIASVVFYLITTIVETDIERQVDHGQLIDRAGLKAAVDVLESFDFPGLGRLTLRRLKFQKPQRPDKRLVLSRTTEKYFKNSEVKKNDIAALINAGPAETDPERLLEILENFTGVLEASRRYITDAVEMNKTLCDYEYGEVGFQQSAPYVEDTAFWQYTKANCEFAYTVVRHFLMTDFMITQCQSIAFVLADNADNHYEHGHLTECLENMNKSILSMEHGIVYFLDFSLIAIDRNRLLKPTNRKVLDSILGATLYFNNVRTYIELLDLADLETPNEEEPGRAFYNSVLSKLENLKRQQALVVNLIEHYTVDNCEIPSPRMAFIQPTNADIRVHCKEQLSGERNESEVIRCVDDMVANNCEAFTVQTIPVAERNYSFQDFTFAKFMMDDVFDKSENPFNGLSMLKRVKVQWEGELKNFEEIRVLVTTEMHPKYLIKYLSTTINAVMFILYEIIKTIVQTSAQCKNDIIYGCFTDKMLQALKSVSCKHFSLESCLLYKTIVRYFKEYLTNVDAVDKKLALIHLIESEQSYLGLVYGFDENKTVEAIHVMPKNASEKQKQYKTSMSGKENFKKSVTFRSLSTGKHVVDSTENLLQVSFQTSDSTCQENIYKLLTYSKNVEEVLPYLKHIAHLLDARQVIDIVIQ